MELIDVQHIWTKGGSIRVTVQLAGGPRKPSATLRASSPTKTASASTSRLIMRPIYARSPRSATSWWRWRTPAHARGQQVAGYGISVGTTTLLPQFGLEGKIDFLVDDDPRKGNLMAGPGYDIPILPPAALYERKPALVVVFAWRYVDPIRAIHPRYFADGGKSVVPLRR